MTPATLAACALRLRSGAPLAVVADDAATTPAALRRALRRYLVPLAVIREDGRTARARRVAAHYATRDPATLAAWEGVHASTVRADLRRAGVRRRPAGWRGRA